MDTLKFKRIDRIRVSNQTPRSFLDFEVSGLSIYSELVTRKFDYVSCLGWADIIYEKKARSRLLLKEPAEMPKDRVGLYICPECIDPMCGAITISISEDDEKIVWSELAYDNGWSLEPEMYVYQALEGLGPYYFDKAEYVKTIQSQTY